ncbi:glycosyltransferase [Undibacterium parvum]|uniref:Glycosyltransferase n=2 Tax=Undibacterium TaxID=401469 RepID=A0A6M4A6E1_9BURK|nr:glycosyltransferase [Undibacterium parvum]AZP11728.1 glycosyltransferase [Undibacterium parvum]QJQ06167.1 glycosyltransferase [Undibacterium piscinae]
MTHTFKPALVIVTPVYEDVEASSQLFQELHKTFGSDVYVVAVDDGSVRQPVDIASLQTAGLDGVIIKLKRNVGHQRAIAIGINYVADKLPDAERVVVMDSDGEDLPESIKQLILALEAPEVDVVVAQRKSRVETLRFRAFYVAYKWMFQLLTGRTISFGNFMALKPAAVQRLSAMQELWIHVAGCTLTSKLRLATCPLDRGSRYAGQSKMNFVGLALHGFKGLMVFAEDVLVRVGIACALVAILSVLASVAAVALKLFGVATPGWFSVALGILLLVFLQTGALTLMTLMLTGVVRGGLVANVAYRDFVDTITHAHPSVTL